MKSLSNTIPGYEVNDYKIVLNPHPELQHKVAEVRKQFNVDYQINRTGNPRANLALVTFSQLEMMQGKIVNHLKNIAIGYPPFKVELKDFGSYPTHSIFINVTTKVAIQNLVKTIRSKVGKMMKLNDEIKPFFIPEPHFQIGSKLLPWQYEKAWLIYSNRPFTGRFIADSMLLLKRKTGEKGWQIVQRFEFQNLPVNTKQGELFI